MIVILLTLVLYTSAFAQDVAERLAGEGAQLVAQLSNDIGAFDDAVCTVKNRLEAGWAPERVLDAYYAPSKPTTQFYVDRTFNILNGNLDVSCGALYYMYSNQDVVYLGIAKGDVIRTYQSPRHHSFGLNYVNR